MTVVVVDYGVGNLAAIPSMLARLGVRATISADPADIGVAERIILPGVGAFDAGMAALEHGGLRAALDSRVCGDGVPTLGLCLGMHLMFEGSEEGDRPGLGWLHGRVARFQVDGMARPRPIPNMGWLDVTATTPDPLMRGFGDDVRFYFAHSYHAVPDVDDTVVATAEYGYTFPAIVRRSNIVAAQFHPEKSHRFGLELLRNFVEAG